MEAVTPHKILTNKAGTRFVWVFGEGRDPPACVAATPDEAKGVPRTNLMAVLAHLDPQEWAEVPQV